MSIAIIFDLIMLAVLICVAIGYAKRGFVAGLVRFLGNLASLVGAILLSNQVAPLLFEHFFQGNIVDKVEDVISVNTTIDPARLVEMYAGFLPQNLKDTLITGAEGILGHVGNGPELAVQLVEGVIAPLLTPIIAIVIFFVSFALCRLLVSFVVAVLTNLNRIPELGGVNRVMGLVMGVLAGSVDLYLVLCGVWAVIVITGGALSFLNEAVLADSFVYQLFGKINPFY